MGLSAAFLSAVALMSCSSLVKSKSGVVLVVDGVEYTAEDLFNDQKTPAAAEAKFNAVYKVAVRAYFKEGKPGFADMAEVTNDTKIKISEQKSQAQSNADKNGTSYDEEWQKILDSNNVDDEQGLYDKFEYDFQKEKFENKFYDEHYPDLRSGATFPGLKPEETFGYKFKNYLEGKQPYHIKHILIKLDSAKAGDCVNTEISAKDAANISGVITSLARGDSFESVSDIFNKDDVARENHASLGIMSRDTSFVNDFKLGIYMYESFFGSSTATKGGYFQAKIAKNELFGEEPANGYPKGTAGYYAEKINELTDLDPTSYTDKHGIGQIPYGAAVKLGEYADVDFGDSTKAQVVKRRFKEKGIDTSKVAAKFYPRNVIFNKYFNKHNIMVITPVDEYDYNSDTEAKTLGKWVNTTKKQRTNKPDLYYGKYNTNYAALDGFNKFFESEKNGDTLAELPIVGTGGTNRVLRDEKGRVILVFRSGTGDSSSNDAYQGIHFVVIERSPFIGLEYDEGEVVETNPKQTSLDEYYTNYYPEQPGGNHPKYNDDKDWKKTFVNYFPSIGVKKLKERADTVKGELKKCDAKLDTYLYQKLIKDGEIVFTDKAKELKIEDSINNWIKLARTTNELDTQKSWDETWEAYYYSLKNQAEQRKEEVGGETINGRYIPEVCAIAFAGETSITDCEDNLSNLFGEGGVFHD